MPTHNNQFNDSFSVLTNVGNQIKNLKIRVNQTINKLLPGRILSKANIFNTTINVASDLANTVLLHVEDSLVEQNIDIAQKELSVRGLSTLSGHHATRPISSTGVLLLKPKHTLSSVVGPKMIMTGTTFMCQENNLTYVVTKSDPIVVSSNDSSILLNVIEGTYENIRYVASGIELEKIELDSIGAIEQSHINVYVNGKKWSRVDSLYDAGATTETYWSKNGIGSQVDIIFGDDVHGKKLSEGDVVEITMLITSGENGNVGASSKWQSITGVYNTSGEAVDINEHVDISVKSGFVLGSNGEHIETTRALAGYNSRSLSFIQASNLRAYLSRLSILSHIDVWNDQDDLIFNILVLPNIHNKLTTWSDYYTLDNSAIKLDANQKQQLIQYIQESKSQVVSTELLLHEPVFKPYAMFVYIDAQFVDKNKIKTLIQESIAKVMLENTFIDVDMNAANIISETAFLRELMDINEINQVNIDIVSEENELARINGYYETTEITYVGSVKQVNVVTKTVDASTNPKLGFDELGGIVQTNKKHIPLLRGGFKKYNGVDNDPIELTKPIYIFYKTLTGYEEL